MSFLRDELVEKLVHKWCKANKTQVLHRSRRCLLDTRYDDDVADSILPFRPGLTP